MDLGDVVVREYGWMLSQAWKLCRNKMDAEDLAEDAVLKILCSRQCYDEKRPFRPWASVIILNTYITRFNHESLITFADMENTLPAVSFEDASSHAVMSDVWSAVMTCRERSPITVDCLIMFVSGYSYEEIALRQGIPRGTVRSRINYARNIIRKSLGNNTLNNV